MKLGDKIKSDEEITAYEQKLLENVNKKKTQEELYKSIVDDIKERYNGTLSEPEAHEAARNLIEFCKILLKYHSQ